MRLFTHLCAVLLALHVTLFAQEPPVPVRVFGSSPPMNYLLYALNPRKMIGLNFSAKNANNNANERYIATIISADNVLAATGTSSTYQTGAPLQVFGSLGLKF
ncbi:MAG: hypothetical protein JXK05_06435 [Campylobacterales bacterium]|nr:hypothetical protein [Campylobacterales bacterium]